MDIDLDKMKELFGKLDQYEREKLIRNLRSITFNFKINKSFLNYPQHPLTIPKEFYPFLDIHGIIKSKMQPSPSLTAQQLRVTYNVQRPVGANIIRSKSEVLILALALAALKLVT